MAVQTLLEKDAEKYGGQFVATRSFKEKAVISHGDSPVKAYEDAKRQSVENPVVFFVPQRDVVHIY